MMNGDWVAGFSASQAVNLRCPVIPVGQWGPQELLAPYAVKPDVGTAAWISCAGHLPYGQSLDQRHDDADSLTWDVDPSALGAAASFEIAGAGAFSATLSPVLRNQGELRVGAPSTEASAVSSKGPNIQGIGVRNQTHSSAAARAAARVASVRSQGVLAGFKNAGAMRRLKRGDGCCRPRSAQSAQSVRLRR